MNGADERPDDADQSTIDGGSSTEGPRAEDDDSDVSGPLSRLHPAAPAPPPEERIVPDPVLAFVVAVPFALVTDAMLREGIAAAVPGVVRIPVVLLLWFAAVGYLARAEGEGARWARRFAVTSGILQLVVVLAMGVLRLAVGTAAFRLELYEEGWALSTALAGGSAAILATIFAFGAALTWLVAER